MAGCIDVPGLDGSRRRTVATVHSPAVALSSRVEDSDKPSTDHPDGRSMGDGAPGVPMNGSTSPPRAVPPDDGDPFVTPALMVWSHALGGFVPARGRLLPDAPFASSLGLRRVAWRPSGNNFAFLSQDGCVYTAGMAGVALEREFPVEGRHMMNLMIRETRAPATGMWAGGRLQRELWRAALRISTAGVLDVLAACAASFATTLRKGFRLVESFLRQQMQGAASNRMEGEWQRRFEAFLATQRVDNDITPEVVAGVLDLVAFAASVATTQPSTLASRVALFWVGFRLPGLRAFASVGNLEWSLIVGLIVAAFSKSAVAAGDGGDPDDESVGGWFSRAREIIGLGPQVEKIEAVGHAFAMVRQEKDAGVVSGILRSCRTASDVVSGARAVGAILRFVQDLVDRWKGINHEEVFEVQSRKVREILALPRPMLVTSPAAYARELGHATGQLQALVRLSGRGDNMVIESLIRQSLARQADLKSILQTNRKHVDPFVVYLGGAAGVGKSTLQPLVMAAVWEAMVRMRHANGPWFPSRVYPIDMTAEYFDSYMGQELFYMDDISLNVREHPEVAGLWCNLVSSAPVSLNAAWLENKGNLWAECKGALVVDNFPVPQMQGLVTEKEAAFHRRFSLVFEAKPTDRPRDNQFSHVTWIHKEWLGGSRYRPGRELSTREMMCMVFQSAMAWYSDPTHSLGIRLGVDIPEDDLLNNQTDVPVSWSRWSVVDGLAAGVEGGEPSSSPPVPPVGRLQELNPVQMRKLSVYEPNPDANPPARCVFIAQSGVGRLYLAETEEIALAERRRILEESGVTVDTFLERLMMGLPDSWLPTRWTGVATSGGIDSWSIALGAPWEFILERRDEYISVYPLSSRFLGPKVAYFGAWSKAKIAAVGVGVTVVLAIVSMLVRWLESTTQEAEACSGPARGRPRGQNQRRRQGRYTRAVGDSRFFIGPDRPPEPDVVFKAQGDETVPEPVGNQHQESFATSLIGSLVRVEWDGTKGRHLSLWGLPVGDKSILIPHHFTVVMDADAHDGAIVVSYRSRVVRVQCVGASLPDGVSWTRVGTRDLIVMNLARPEIQSFGSRIHLVQSRSDADHEERDGLIVSGADVVDPVRIRHSSTSPTIVYTLGNHRTTRYRLDDGLLYEWARSAVGMCGSVVVSGNSIVGMMVCGTTRWLSKSIITTGAELLYREDILAAMQDDQPDVDLPSIGECLDLVGETYGVKPVASIVRGFPPPTSDLVWNPTLGRTRLWPEVTRKRPVRLGMWVDDEGRVQHWSIDALEKWCKASRRVGLKPISGETVAAVSNWLIRVVDASLRKSNRRWEHFSWDDVLVGVPGWYEGLDLSKSAGSNRFGYAIKRDFCEKVGSSWRLKPAVVAVLDEAWGRLSRGEKLEDVLPLEDRVSIAVGKDEKRKPGKAARAIYPSPFIRLMCQCRAFGNLHGALASDPLGTKCGVGLNPFTDWCHLGAMYERTGVVDIDVKDHDINIPESVLSGMADVLEAVARHYCEPAGVELARGEREVLIAFAGRVYKFKHGMVSGTNMTTARGGICWRLTMTETLKEVLGCSAAEAVAIWEAAEAMTYGDDLIANELLVARCGMDKFVEFVTAIGYTLTSGVDKSQAPSVLPIDQVSFIGRRFVRHGTRWLCPLDKVSFVSVFGYRSSRMCEGEFARAITPSVVTEAAQYGPEGYAEVAEAVGSMLAVHWRADPFKRAWGSVIAEDVDPMAVWQGFAAGDETCGGVVLKRGLVFGGGVVADDALQSGWVPLPIFGSTTEQREDSAEVTISYIGDLFCGVVIRATDRPLVEGCDVSVAAPRERLVSFFDVAGFVLQGVALGKTSIWAKAAAGINEKIANREKWAKAAAPINKAIASRVSPAASGTEEASGVSAPPPPKKARPSIPAKIVRGVKKAVGAVTGSIGKVAGIAESATTAVSGLATLFGLDRPPALVGLTQPCVVSASVTAPSTAITLEWEGDALIHGAGATSEMLVSELGARSATVFLLPWTTAKTLGGALLTNAPINPIMLFVSGVASGDFSNPGVPPSAIPCFPARTWTADMVTITIEVISSAFHIGKIIAVVTPEASTTDYTGLTHAPTLAQGVMDISQNRVLVLEVENPSPFPGMRAVPLIGGYDPAIIYRHGDNGAGAVVTNFISWGALTIQVDSPLTGAFTADGATAFVQVSYAWKNLRVFGPAREYWSSGWSWEQSNESGYVEEGEALGLETTVSPPIDVTDHEVDESHHPDVLGPGQVVSRHIQTPDVFVLSWSTSSASIDFSSWVDLPKAVVDGNPAVAAMMANARWMRSRMRLTVYVTCPPTVYGLVYVVARPYSQGSPDPSVALATPTHAEYYPHLRFVAGGTHSGVIELEPGEALSPWCLTENNTGHIYQFRMGTYRLAAVCYTGVHTVGVTAPITVRVSVRFEDLTTFVPSQLGIAAGDETVPDDVKPADEGPGELVAPPVPPGTNLVVAEVPITAQAEGVRVFDTRLEEASGEITSVVQFLQTVFGVSGGTTHTGSVVNVAGAGNGYVMASRATWDRMPPMRNPDTGIFGWLRACYTFYRGSMELQLAVLHPGMMSTPDNVTRPYDSSQRSTMVIRAHTNAAHATNHFSEFLVGASGAWPPNIPNFSDGTSAYPAYTADTNLGGGLFEFVDLKPQTPLWIRLPQPPDFAYTFLSPPSWVHGPTNREDTQVSLQTISYAYSRYPTGTAIGASPVVSVLRRAGDDGRLSGLRHPDGLSTSTTQIASWIGFAAPPVLSYTT